ncbi:magnesium chelatase [Thermincola ferriacetica]|uniref:Magnesium chelatase n=1 Tax=Thermincola ferriacetica TaxID=281456 RepID=A0A0L6W060_9FIRM|nr:magnesium chelatase [Thermincola ferriacetica]KNZ68861.1 magnesium chelatase [Thermincola ferriacetica]
MRSYTQLTRHDGNAILFEVVEMGIISTLWEVPLHIHAEGLRGTGKTTIMRAARQIMPPIVRIKNCLYNCDPEKPHCPNHKHLSREEIEQLGTEIVPRPFLEISHSAKIGTIAGSIDLAKITNAANPEAALLPGIIPQAHRGIIFIDEINRLADTSPEITDVLLDLMGTKPGRVQIEETGLPLVEIPVQASVWAASNPDEEPGPLQEIRRQLSDRFDLVVEMGRSHNQESIAEILQQSEQRRLSKNRVSQETIEHNEKLQKEMERIAKKYETLQMPDYLRNYIARLYVKYNLESFRAIEAIQHAAVLHCALRQRDKVLVSDIVKVIPLALRHRVDMDTLTKIMNSSADKVPNDGTPPMSFANSVKKKEPGIFSSEPDRENELNYADGDKEVAQDTAGSLFSPLKNLFSRKDKGPKVEESDSIKAAPLNKAKKIHDLNLDELLNSEEDLK